MTALRDRNRWAAIASGLFVVAAAVVLSGVIVAAEQVTLVQLGHPGHGTTWTQFMESRIAAFQALYPNVTIERVLAPGEDTTEKFLSMIAGGIAPDITEMTLIRVGNLAPAGHFLDLDPFFERDGSVSKADFAGVALSALTAANGALVGIPLDVWPTATFYNEDLFAEAGLAFPRDLAAADWNWEYVVQAGTALTVDKDGDGLPEQWGIDTALGMLSYYIPVMQAGGSMYDRLIDPTRSTLLAERTLQGLEWLADLFRRGIAAPSDVRFAAGRSGMNFTSGTTTVGDLAAAGSVRFGTAPPTRGPGNDGTYIAVNSVQITRYTRHQDLAWEWVKFLAADPESVAEFVTLTNRLTANLGMIGEYPRLSGKDPALIRPFIDAVQNPHSYHPALGPGVGAAENLLAQVFVSRIVEGGSPVRTALEEVTPQIDALLAAGRTR